MIVTETNSNNYPIAGVFRRDRFTTFPIVLECMSIKQKRLEMEHGSPISDSEWLSITLPRNVYSHVVIHLGAEHIRRCLILAIIGEHVFQYHAGVSVMITNLRLV